MLYNYFDDLDDVVAGIVTAMLSDTIKTDRTIVADPATRPIADVLIELGEAVVRSSGYSHEILLAQRSNSSARAIGVHRIVRNLLDGLGRP